MRIGLISDTHGLLRPEALAFLRGSNQIIHAGDITGPEILGPLKAIAPLTVVRGNSDRGPWARTIPETAVLRIGPVAIYVIHDLKELPLDPAAEGMRVVVSGHSHKRRASCGGGDSSPKGCLRPRNPVRYGSTCLLPAA